MSEPLLLTKLYVPPLRPYLVPRPRLINTLNQGLQDGHKLTLISAPAGFGKTTLANEWIQTLGSATPPVAVAWVSLDEADNDLPRFLAYLITALNQSEGTASTFGKSALAMLQSPQPPPTTAALTPLINELAALPEKIVLVLDDYHLIEADARPIHEAISFLLENSPPQIHLVIATREDPYLPLSRLRARNQLTELRAIDLRFSSAETADFLNQVMGLGLAANDIAALEARTEGWITGLQLAALALRGQVALQGSSANQPGMQASDFINSFAGSHRYVLDYLIEEVLEQQPETVQMFLLETAVLNRLTGPLCDALTGQKNGQETLQTLDHANLFVIPLDSERRWYRYHHLFAELLRQQLQQSQPEEVSRLHQQASTWYEQNGFTHEATEHAFLAKDFERAAQLIQVQADTTWQQGEHGKLRRWLPKLPDEVLLAKPILGIYHAWYLFASGQHETAEQLLQSAEQALNGSTEKVHLKGRVAAIRAFMSSYQGNAPGIIQHARQALADLSEQDSVWRSISAIVLGDAYGFKGDMSAAYAARSEALQFCQAAGETYYTMLAGMKVAVTLRSQGQLQQTIDMCQQQIQFADQVGLSQTSLAGLLWAIWGEALAELNDLDGAMQQVRKAAELVPLMVDLVMLGWGYMCLLRIYFSRGELDKAEKIIQKMENIDRVADAPRWIMNELAAWQARLWLEQKNLEAATQWAADRGFNAYKNHKPLPEMNYFLLFDYIILARVLLAQGQLEEAARLLNQLLEPARTGQRTTRVIEILLLQALTYQALGAPDRAIASLKQAIDLAEPQGFIRIFADEGPPMGQLLQEALNRGIAPAYVRRLLAAFSSSETNQANTTSFQADQSALVEPLSERELEILQLISEGLTNPEIATRLFLSLNTVKVHTRNIYGKLDAHTRTQAVAKGRALGILAAVN